MASIPIVDTNGNVIGEVAEGTTFPTDAQLQGNAYDGASRIDARSGVGNVSGVVRDAQILTELGTLSVVTLAPRTEVGIPLFRQELITNAARADIQNCGTGTIELRATGATIDGMASVTVPPGRTRGVVGTARTGPGGTYTAYTSWLL